MYVRDSGPPKRRSHIRSLEPVAGTRAKVEDTPEIEELCANVSLSLLKKHRDQTALLKSARKLKAANRHLRSVVHDYERREGRSTRVIMAEQALEAMENNLRSVLLDHATLGQRELRDRLNDSVERSFDVFAVLGATKN